MTETGGKRKGAPTGRGDGRNKKKKTGGNAGKWKTPHHQAKGTSGGLSGESSLQPGDTGIWVTCARHQENKSAREAKMLFTEYAEKVYGIKEDAGAGPDDEDDGDIEAAIQKEIAALNTKGTGDEAPLFTPLKMSVDCLLFFKTRAPIEPVEFVRRICQDAKACADPGQLKSRYMNRLTPSTIVGKASENGIIEVAKQALAPFFDLSGKRAAAVVNAAPLAEPVVTEEPASEGGTGQTAQADGAEASVGADGQGTVDVSLPASGIEDAGAKPQQDKQKAFTFAIRPTIRNNGKIKRDFVINEVAGLINNERHKVNLTAPDKVILIDVYQAVCGMSVVDGDWEELKRYNLTELYGLANKVKLNEEPSGEKEAAVARAGAGTQE
ncbi:hypothetical protein B0H63DRAFT_522110 [Podospora didyma]|uniref:THUMP domain-containing protein n=1 Tax=Podospora didyma TaxID=330526 RepID=A0AAE0NNI7_9PEZI|nr:hypothetical protein B0H63DRAFT_522110 [Podospora didyma]